MNGRVLSFVAVLVTGGFFVARGAFSQSTASATRRVISLPDDNAQLPFSGGILAGNTLYLSGRIRIDSKTGKAPAEIDDEIKLLLDHVKAILTAAGMTMRRRSVKARPAVLLDETPREDELPASERFADSGPNPEQVFVSTELREIISENLDELSPLLRTAFVLGDVQGYSTG